MANQSSELAIEQLKELLRLITLPTRKKMHTYLNLMIYKL